MGGENEHPRDCARDKPGSSPRGRGKRPSLSSRPRARRLIPAWAGKTTRTKRRARPRRAHPRVGGENSVWKMAATALTGSSPRGRGKRGGDGGECRDSRLIPAWAGKTVASSVVTICAAAHPRVGGENREGSGLEETLVGSSPRGRGKHRTARDDPDPRGLIPAWAGKTSAGSPPPGLGGLIPAWAGKTSGRDVTSGHGAAHPRVGGENIRGPHPVQALRGSSPRGRGKPRADSHHLENDRLIPAWAGKTSRMDALLGSLEAHPRVGGENAFMGHVG